MNGKTLKRVVTKSWFKGKLIKAGSYNVDEIYHR